MEKTVKGVNINMDKYEHVIYRLCETLDTMLYFPFKDQIKGRFGFVKEKYKQFIEDTINKLKED